VTPQERAYGALAQLAHAMQAKASTDDLARAVGELIGAAVRCGQAWRTAAASWLRLGVGR
jgi:hypothetical protein